MNLTILLAISIAVFGCKAKQKSTSDAAGEPASTSKLADQVDEQDELRMKGPADSSPLNSKIIGRVVKVYAVQDSAAPFPFCDEAPCVADVEVLALPYRSRKFHGQYNEGDTLTMEFMFTLESSEKRFPELNKPLPGLVVNSYFEAELFEDDQERYRIQVYEKKG